MIMSAHEMKHKNRAFILIDIKPGEEKKILEQLMKYDEVIEAHIVLGQEFGLIAVLEIQREILETPQEKILKIVVEKIRKTRGVRDTKTIISAFSLTKK